MSLIGHVNLVDPLPHHLNGKTAGCVCTNRLRAEDEVLDLLKFSPAEIQMEVLSVCDEETLVVKTPFVLQCFYFLKSIAEGLDTNLPSRMSHGGELPGFLKRLLRNIHAHIPENLCNLRGEGRKKKKNHLTQESSIYNIKIFVYIIEIVHDSFWLRNYYSINLSAFRKNILQRCEGILNM